MSEVINHENLQSLTFFDAETFEDLEEATRDGACYKVNVCDLSGSIFGSSGTIYTAFEAAMQVANCIKGSTYIGFALYDRDGTELERGVNGKPESNSADKGHDPNTIGKKDGQVTEISKEPLLAESKKCSKVIDES